MIKSLGNGSAFNLESNNNSVCIKSFTNLIVLDCGEGTLKSIIAEITDEVSTVSFFITHMHPDHIAGLGNAIFYLKMNLNRRVVVYALDSKIVEWLSLQAIPVELYDFVPLEINDTLELECVLIKTLKQIHVPNILSCSFHIIKGREEIFYSGDGNLIPQEILSAFRMNKSMKIFQEITIYSQCRDIHMYLPDLAKIFPLFEDRRRIYCMHLEGEVAINKVKELGFQVMEQGLEY